MRRGEKKSWSARTVFALGLTAAAGLLIAAEELPEFSHQFHIEEVEVECDACHVESEAKPAPFVDAEHCTDCHDEGFGYQMPAKARRLAARFDHRPHAAAKLACDACHAGIPEDEIDAEKPWKSQAECESCHRDKKVKLSMQRCTSCHEPDASKVRPADHDQAWTLRHGQEARWRVFDEHGRDCEQCHRSRQSCNSCHRERRPRDHNALWANRMHGSAAAWDRERCQTCHEPNVCLACHRNATPPSHVGNWQRRHGRVADGFDNNCQVCHQRSWCTACHRQEW